MLRKPNYTHPPFEPNLQKPGIKNIAQLDSEDSERGQLENLQNADLYVESGLPLRYTKTNQHKKRKKMQT